MGMGKRGFCYPGADSLIHSSLLSLMVLLALTSSIQTGECQAPPHQCHIQKCTTDFVSLTSHLSPSLDGFEFCKALRAYSACTQRTAKSCRGNLVFHSAMLGISDLMSQRNCSKDGPTSATHPETPAEPCDYHSQPPVKNAPPIYLFCGLFGDPHLRTFKDHFQTCKVEGAWPLIDNNYLSVQVTNVPVVPGSHATATIKITMIFKPYQDCTEQKVYQAVTDDLPAAFMDGSVSGGGAANSHSLWITEKAAGRHMEIHAGYIGTTVVVRQLGRYLTLAVRVPREVAMAFDDETQDLQLCVNGCPAAERIDWDGHLPLPAEPGLHWPVPQHQHRQPSSSLGLVAAPQGGFTLKAAMATCQEQLEIRDIYFHSCVFDLLTTGDTNFTSAAYNALKDMEMLHPTRERWRIFPKSSSPMPYLLHFKLLLLCSLFLVFL
ncbi:hypothetical protein JZ751_011853 [Albula glossodonta]|uniref:Uncharacterized protein n=1 Tax=Albula glossodonta TaxID=121402 RepID=A0A8T2PR17_9TELE|nr:hypothetical protein JZ751_011853 [Albula glossodonta]